MLVPLYGFVEGDTMGLLVLAHHDMDMRQVAKLMSDSAAVRVAQPGAEWEMHVGGQAVSDETTVSELGLDPLARIDLRVRRA